MNIPKKISAVVIILALVMTACAPAALPTATQTAGEAPVTTPAPPGSQTELQPAGDQFLSLPHYEVGEVVQVLFYHPDAHALTGHSVKQIP